MGRTLKRAASKLSLSSREKSGSTLSVSGVKGPFGTSTDQDAQSIKSEKTKSTLRFESLKKYFKYSCGNNSKNPYLISPM